MTNKYQNKFRISSARLQNWDYGWNAPYFVTICTQNREFYFGDIVETQCIASQNQPPCIAAPQYKMQLSKIGKIVETEWLKTFEMRPDMNLQMGEFVVMPNHFHAIIIIGKNEYNNECRDAMHRVSTTKNKFGPQSKNLASIIRGFKSAVTCRARNIHADFAWQPRFYEHVIRNKKTFKRIQFYIINNPLNWRNDKLNER